VTRVNVYDTSLFEDSAEIWAAFDYDRIRGRWSDEDSDGRGSRGTGRGEAVILTGNGRAKWVLEKWTNWGGEGARHERLDDEDAREWLERNGFDAAVAEHFGGSLTDALHDAAMYGEVTARRDEIIRACKRAGADVTQIAKLMRLSRPTVYAVLGEQGAEGQGGGGRRAAGEGAPEPGALS
jgi:hypothetical protein